jgi:hypothetical protein
MVAWLTEFLLWETISKKNATEVELKSEEDGMNTYDEEESRYADETEEETLTAAEAPGQVLDPLAEPVGSRGTQRMVVTEFDEEDARERPPEDGLNPEIPEDENLRASPSLNWNNELEDTTWDQLST